MGYLRVNCRACGHSWRIKPSDDWYKDEARRCKNCKAEIDAQDWNGQILPAFGAMMDANRELIKTSKGYNGPLFSVEFIEDLCAACPCKKRW